MVLWRVLLHVAVELESREDVQLPMACDAGVIGFQNYKCLDNQPHSVLSRLGVYLTFDWYGVPSSALSKNCFRAGTGSLYDTSKGLRYTSLQNLDQFSQYPSTAVVCLEKRTLVMLLDIERKLLWKQARLAESTATREASGCKCGPCTT